MVSHWSEHGAEKRALGLLGSTTLPLRAGIPKPVGMNIPVDPPRFSRTAGLGGGIFIRTRLIHTTAHMHGHHEATINGAGWVELGCVKA